MAQPAQPAKFDRVIRGQQHGVMSGRALASAFHLANGSDGALVSRPSIGKIKDAWADVYTELVLSATGAAVASESAALPR